jgi:transcriptional regulator with XRE-family HTH domain
VHPESAGQRIARARRRRGLSQAVLAGLVGRSESWLSQVERGKRSIDSHSVLTRIASILRIDISEITETSGTADDRHLYTTAELIERAMVSYGTGAGEDTEREPQFARRITHLRARAESAYREYQATRYEATGRLIAGLIREVEIAAQAAEFSDPRICEVRALVYDTAAALLNRVGEPGLAWAAADRAMTAANAASNPLLPAVGAWRLSYIVTSRRHPQEAMELAMNAATTLEHEMRAPSPEQLSVYGALHLAAATASAANHDQGTATALLNKARRIAEQTGNGNYMGTAFGDVNVSLHAISALLQFGDARSAIEIGEALDDSALPQGLVGRRTQMHLDLARAYALRRQDAAAVNVLLTAERISPELVRYNRRTREVLTELLRREHRPSTPELRPLAQRAGIV